MAGQSTTYWISDLQGMNQRQSAFKIPDKSSPFLLNISLVSPGTWTKRKGIALIGPEDTGDGILGLHDYVNIEGIHSLRAVKTKDLQVYSETTNTWSTTVAGVYGVRPVAHVNYKNRSYSVSLDKSLRWEDGGGTTAVGVGVSEITAQNLCVAQQTLFVGKRDGYEDRVYYSLFDVANNVPGDQLWNDTETDLATSTRFFSTITENTCCYTYGVTGLSYHFSETACYSFDIKYAENSTGVQKVFDVGCCGPRAITTCNGWMVWMDPSARIWAWGGAGPPMPLSWAIEDDTNKKAVINKISKANGALKNVCAGVDGNVFFFSIGDVSLFEFNLQNVLIVGLVSQNLKAVLWSLYDLPYRPTVFANAVLAGEPVLLFGVDGRDDVFQLGVGTNDNGLSINAIARTKFYNFGRDYLTKEGQALYVQYEPQGVEGSYLDIQTAKNGNNFYYPLSTPNQTGVDRYTNGGVVGLYDTEYETKKDEVKKVMMQSDTRFRTLSVEISNNQLDQEFAISALGYELGSLHGLDKSIESIDE